VSIGELPEFKLRSSELWHRVVLW